MPDRAGTRHAVHAERGGQPGADPAQARRHVPLMAPKYIALSGGVGGAKLAFGLARTLPPDDLLIVANTGDDFDHLGLRICPDLDSHHVRAGRLREPGAGLGHRRRKLELHGGPGAARRRHLVRTRRPRPRDARRAHRPPAPGRVADGGHPGAVCCTGHRPQGGADVGRPGGHARRHARRRAELPGLLRPPSLRATGHRLPLPAGASARRSRRTCARPWLRANCGR